MVQWATGTIGRPALAEIIDHPELDLVGVWVHSQDKIGKDAGELVGRAPVGIIASGDVDELIALRPDCVSYMAASMDYRLVCRLLRAGINVVTTCNGYLTGANFPKWRAEFEAAAREGGATLHGTGFNPGYIEVAAGFLTATSRRVHSVEITETLDCTTYPVAEAWTGIGFGRPFTKAKSGPYPFPPDTPDGRTSPDAPGFFDALDLIADMTAIQFDSKQWTVEYAATTRDIDLGWIRFGEGSVAGQRRRFSGFIGDRAVATITVCWTFDSAALDCDWDFGEGYRIVVEGDPRVDATIEFGPSRIPGLSTHTDPMGVLMAASAMPAVQAIPFVCDSAPGLTSMLDIPLIGGRHTVV